jgi:hypothetical protein
MYKVHVGNVYFFLRFMHFQHQKIKKAPYYKAAVPGSNQAKASIPSWQHKLAA